MTLVCPHCNRPLPPSDEPARFCSFCGQRLRVSTEEVTRDLQATTGYNPASGEGESIPAAIGGYRVGRTLGTGGMGRVHEGEPIGGGPKVAIKLLSGRLQANPTSVERFRQEGRLAAQIAHPRCVFVLGADTDAGRPYIVMELMPGDTLKEIIEKRGTIPPIEAIRYILDVIDGLQEAHRLGVIHRDVKPSNCFVLPDGRVKVGDFGLSKSLGGSTQLTQSGAFLGTILYASPEQIKGEPVDFASDVYSVSATLYHLLAGRAPFHHENPTAVLAKIISEDPPSIRSINPSIPADLARVVHRGLERDRDRRYATLAEMRADLAALVPEQLTFGGLWIRLGAFILDDILLRLFLFLPLRILSNILVDIDFLNRLLPWLVFLVYFTLFETFLGWTVGKWLLGLRVCRIGTTRPPDFKQASLRTFIFFVLITLTISPAIFNSGGIGSPSRALFFSVLPFFLGLGILVVPMRRSNDFRGLHDKLSGTCVLRLPQVPRPVTLIGRHGDRLEALAERPKTFPTTIGAYTIRKAFPMATGWLAVGDDAVLSRRVLIRLRLGQVGKPSRVVGRPGRLWLLGNGSIVVQDKEYSWDAYVAPTGAPLADVVEPSRPVRWPETRPILEELAEELAAAEADGTLPNTLSLDQVWVEADGRARLLDFALAPSAAISSKELIRQAAATLLEGQTRPIGDLSPIRAPIPRHASRLLATLTGPDSSVASFRREASETRRVPARVTRAARSVQLGLHTLINAIGLGFMLIASSIYPLIEVMSDDAHMQRMEQLHSAEHLLSRLPEYAGIPYAQQLQADPERADRLRIRVQREQMQLRSLEPELNSQETLGLKAYLNLSTSHSPSDIVEQVSTWENASEAASLGVVSILWFELVIAILVWPFFCLIEAIIFRGGIANLLTGIVLARTLGGPAQRRQAAARAFLIWLPFTFLISLSVVCRAMWPDVHAFYETVWFCGFVTLLLYFPIALYDPERSPVDRLLGTLIVPR